MAYAAPYVIGCVAMVWVMERIGAVRLTPNQIAFLCSYLVAFARDFPSRRSLSFA